MREYINIRNVGNNNGEILNKFNWDLEFTPPAIVYYPGDNLFKNRLKTVGGLESNLQVTVDEVEVGGGFSVTQVGDSDRKPISVNFEFVDYDDCRIAKFIWDYHRKSMDPTTKRSNLKKDLVCQAVVYQLNTELLPVKKWFLKNGLYESGDTSDGDFTNKKELNGQAKMTIKFEWWDSEYLV